MEANVSYKLSTKPVYQFRHRTFDRSNGKKMRRRRGGEEEEEDEDGEQRTSSRLCWRHLYCVLRTTQSKYPFPLLREGLFLSG